MAGTTKTRAKSSRRVDDLLPPHERIFDPHVGDREEEEAELIEKIDRIPGYAIAFLLDGSAPLWDDDYVDPTKADLWLFFAKHVLQEARKKASEMDGGGGGGELGMLSGMVGGAGGGKNFNTAEVHLQNGQAHYDKKEFAQAMECYKAASNWYFKAGDRKLSDMAKAHARRARAALTEEEVSKTIAQSGTCFCVCEWSRLFSIYAASTKRMATALQSWEKKRDEELSFEAGDCIRVLGKEGDEIAGGFSADQPYTWFRGELRGEEGLFPTTQYMYKPSGKPVLDEDNIHTFRNVTVLDATPLFIAYSAGEGGVDGDGADSKLASDLQEYLKPQLEEVTRPLTAASQTQPNAASPKTAQGKNDEGKERTAKKAQDDEDPQQGQLGTALRQMDLGEFILMLTDLQIACPDGHVPSSFQITRDQALSALKTMATLPAFREANRGEVADDDATQLDFEEFLKAMAAVKLLLRIPDSREQIEEGYWTHFHSSRTFVSFADEKKWACSYGLRLYDKAICDLNTAVKLISSVDETWATLLKHMTEKVAVAYGEFQEAHARQLTSDMKYGWAYDNYEHARLLYSGQTGHEMTEFQPREDKLVQLQRSFNVNQYKNAMQLMRLTAPNASSHKGIPAHVGDPNKPMDLVQKAKDIYEELDDHSAMATTLLTGAELAIRMGDLKEALRLAKICENEFSRLSDTQGLAAAFRILGIVQLVDGQVLEAVGSLQASLQISADNSDVSNELASHELLGRVQLFLSNMQRADSHFSSCLRLSKTAHQVETLGRATAGRGYVATSLGNLDRALEHLHVALGLLRSCDERQEASRVMFEMALIHRFRAQHGWQRRMEEAATLLTRTIPTFVVQKHTLFIARAKAQAWVWRTVSRLAMELRGRMLQGESLVDTMLQLSWESLQEGKSVLAEVEKVGDRLTRADVLLNMVDMQMLGQREAATIQSSIDDARVVFEQNCCQRFLAKCDQLTGRVKIFQQDFKAGKLVLESCNLRLAQAGCTKGIDQVETWWFLAIALRLSGEEQEARDVLAKAVALYAKLGSSRLCSLCSIHIHGACYTCLECYQRDFCKDCYAECALNGRSCHRTSSMIRAARPL